MPRKKQAKQEEMPLTISEPAAPATPEGEAVLEALRSNLALLGELAARYQVDFQPERPADRPQINSPQDVFNLLGPEMSALAQEQLRVLLLNTRNQVMAQRIVYQGNVNSSIVRPAEVFRAAIIDSAPSIIISHNHPSGDPTPSPEDVSITRDLVAGGKLLGIDVLDHIVIAGSKFVSLKEKKLMTTNPIDTRRGGAPPFLTRNSTALIRSFTLQEATHEFHATPERRRPCSPSAPEAIGPPTPSPATGHAPLVPCHVGRRPRSEAIWASL